jgi:hypothetical protein
MAEVSRSGHQIKPNLTGLAHTLEVFCLDGKKLTLTIDLNFGEEKAQACANA